MYVDRNDRVEIEVVVDYTSCSSREWSNIGRQWSNSGREELVFKHGVGIGRGKMGDRAWLGLVGLVWSAVVPTISEIWIV